MTKLRDNPIIYEYPREGLTIKEIEGLEAKYNEGKHFPLAFREFLLLAGVYGSFGGYFDFADGYLDGWMQEEARKEVAACGMVIDRPYFVTDQADGCTTFTFIYLDEYEEDPILYQCFAHKSYWDQVDFIRVVREITLTKHIEFCIDEAIQYAEDIGM